MSGHHQLSLFGALEEIGAPAPGPENIPAQIRAADNFSDNDLELAAMRRDLYQKGRQMGKDLGVESVERFGMPIYKLPRSIVERWLKLLDERKAGALASARGRHG